MSKKKQQGLFFLFLAEFLNCPEACLTTVHYFGYDDDDNDDDDDDDFFYQLCHCANAGLTSEEFAQNCGYVLGTPGATKRTPSEDTL